MFGSGATHKPHALFIQQSKLYNKGRKLNLEKACDGRFAGYYIALHRLLRCKAALLATVHSQQFGALTNVKAIVHRAADDVKTQLFWKRVFVLLRAIFPLLQLLRIADSDKPNMDKLYFLLNKAREHLSKSKTDLMDDFLFPARVNVSAQDQADASFDDAEEVEEDDDDDEYAGQFDDDDEDVFEDEDEWGTLVTDESKGIYKHIVNAVSSRAPKLSHDFAITAWMCSVHPDIMKDVQVRQTERPHVRAAVERCIRKLHAHDVDGQQDGELDQKVDLFWDELKQFQMR